VSAQVNPTEAACATLPPGTVNASCNDAANNGDNNQIAGENGIIRKAGALIAMIVGIGANAVGSN
jgi:hypothetical protein